jgi:hypothetical protein
MPSLRYLGRPCKSFGIIYKGKNLRKSKGSAQTRFTGVIFPYSQAELIRQMSERILLKPWRDKLMYKAEQVAIAHVQ